MDKLTKEEALKLPIEELKQINEEIWEYCKFLDKIIKFKEI